MKLTLSAMRQFAVSRSLFLAPDLLGAVQRLGYVQADPMRAPARAQDLILRHRVPHYQAGDLERAYAELPLEEAYFINYGFMPRDLAQLIHPRASTEHWDAPTKALARQLLAHINSHGTCHPEQVSAHFGREKATNHWGGQSTATTHLLGNMHHHGQIRVARRESGTRVYGVAVESALQSVQQRVAKLMHVLVRQYAPFTVASLRRLGNMLAGSTPQLAVAIRDETKRLVHELPQGQIDGVVWLWPDGESPNAQSCPGGGTRVRLLAPFDPVVWDRERFEQLWGWAYRFEAYTPASKRVRGHYALPLLVGDQVLGWANLSVSTERQLCAEIGFISSAPRAIQRLQQETEAELAAFAQFLGLARLDACITRHRNSVF